METHVNLFDLFEEEIHENVHAAFQHEALSLLKEAELATTKADELFAKVDNMLSSASEMLAYNEYVNLIAMAFACGQHNHALLDMLQSSTHNEHHDQGHDLHEKKEDKEAKVKKTTPSFWLFLMKSKKEAPPKGFLDLLMGVK